MVLVISITGCSQAESSANTQELLIFAAAGTRPPLDEAANIFEQKYGTRVLVNYGGGGEVLSNMVISKTGDIYIAPEQRFMDSARKQEAIKNDAAIRSIAFMIPVIGVKKGNPQNIQTLDDMSRPGIKIIMGNPETMMLGYLTPEILQKAGVHDTVEPNVVTRVPQVAAMVTALMMNQADAGVIWHSFGTTSAMDIDIIWIPQEYVTGIGEIQAAVSAYSQRTEIAEKFIDFLTSDEGNEIFQKNGYITDREEADKYWMGN